MKSLKDKVCEMNGLGIHLSFKDNAGELSDITNEQRDLIFSVADGIVEKFIIDRIECRCSFSEILKWSSEKLEEYVNKKIKELKQINTFIYQCNLI